MEGAVESALQTGFLAVEHGQRLLAHEADVTHPLGLIQLEEFCIVGGVFPLEGVESGFLVVETAQAPRRQG